MQNPGLKYYNTVYPNINLEKIRDARGHARFTTSTATSIIGAGRFPQAEDGWQHLDIQQKK